MKCDICEKEFADKQSMTVHRRWHDLPEYKMFQTRCRISVSNANSGERNGMWKGDKVGYNALHAWVNRHKSKPTFCEKCNKKMPFDLTNISETYKRDLTDWEWLCRGCHMRKDGRIKNLKQYQGSKNSIPKSVDIIG